SKENGTFITVDFNRALMNAKKADKLLNKGAELPSLGGIPLGLQDNICTQGLKTTCNSKMLYNFIPPYDASLIKKLRANNAIIMGKLNMGEFGIEGTPDLARAVAKGQILYGLGADATGDLLGSAPIYNLVAFKPTYGLVSRFGIVALASSLDGVACITKN